MEPKENLNRADYIALAAIWLLLIVRCAITGNGVMWLDELYSFRIIHDPSVGHMLLALGDQSDGAPPEYYLTAKAWSAVFSGSPLSLRMFSSVAFCAGFTILWLAMRRSFNFFPTVFAFALILLHNNTIAFESLNLRFYGLLFALVCLATAMGIRLCQSDHPGGGLLAANLLANAALVLCHPLGGFYGAVILLGVACSDFLSKPLRIRPWVYASYFGGWAALLLWFKQFLRQADINKPHSWVPVPSFMDVCREIHLESNFYLLFLFFALLGLISILTARRHPAAPENPPSRPWIPPRGYLPISLSLIGLLPFFWMFSKIFPANSLFHPRYLIGSTIGWAMLLACLVAYVAEKVPLRSPLIFKVLVPAFVLFALHPLYVPPAQKLFDPSRQDGRIYLTGISDSAFGHLDLPIVCPRAHDFLVRHHYAPDAARYYYLLDWQAVSAPQSLGFTDPVNYKLLAAIKRNYPDTANIMAASEFLREHPIFLLQDIPQANWPALYLKSGTYKITRLEPDRPLSYEHDGEWRLVLVEKQS